MLNTILNLAGRITFLATGSILMVVGMGLGVTMIMLFPGIIIGLIGVAMFVTGLFGDFNGE